MAQELLALRRDLLAEGSVGIVTRLKIQGSACYNKLYAIEGAIKGIRWHHLTKE